MSLTKMKTKTRGATIAKPYSQAFGHHNPVDVRNAVITISWNDEDEDTFEMKMRNIQTFKNALNLFPRVAKALKLK